MSKYDPLKGFGFYLLLQICIASSIDLPLW